MAYKYKPTSDELRIIQEGLYANKSLRSISNLINCNDKTIKVIIKDYSLDMSTYNPRIAHGKSRIKNLSEDQIEEIVSLLEDGVSLRKIVQMYSISMPTLKRILEDKKIEHGHYKRTSEKKFTLTDIERKSICKSILKGVKLKDLAAQYNINRNTLAKHLKEIGIIESKSGLNNEQLMFIVDAHKEGIYIKTIADILNVNKSIVEDCVKNNGVDLSESKKYKLNLKKKQNSFENLLRLFSESYKAQSGEKISKNDIQYVIENIKNYSFIDIVKKLNVDYKRLKRSLIILDQNHIFTFDQLMKSNYKNELTSDLAISAYSNSMIAKKYGSTASTVSEWRKALYGESFSSYYNPSLSKSSFEMEFELLLYSLKIAFIPEYKIENLKYDYSIGHNILIELQGDYWHLDKNESDNIKKEKAEKEGYIVIQIPERDFYKNKDLYAKQIVKKYLEKFSEQFS